MISMTLYCAHRCVSFSLNIREASSYSKWEQIQNPQLDNLQRMRHIETLNFKRYFYNTHLTQAYINTV